MTNRRAAVLFVFLLCTAAVAGEPPEGFTPLFDGTSLDGWKALVGTPITRGTASPDELESRQRAANEEMRAHWRAEANEIINDGHGPHLCTERLYGDFELWLDWKISATADSGIYLRGSPQIQIWDPVGGIDQAKVGSGGLYNNQKNRSTPLVVADRPTGEWNRFFIRMIGERVTVKLNDQLVVDDVVMENYWDRSLPILREQIELQTHGGEIRFRNLYIREVPVDEANEWLRSRASEGFEPIFNGTDTTGWIGSVDGYLVEDGALVCDPASGGILYSEKTYDDFSLRFEFKLPPGGNNGLAIRAPGTGNPAYDGIELQILDNTAEKFAELQDYQYHGSAYGLVPAHRGFLRPVGEWNFQEVVCEGHHIVVRLNGTTILDTNLSKIREPMDGGSHPGMRRRSGHIGFMGHGDRVEFRHIEIRPTTP